MIGQETSTSRLELGSPGNAGGVVKLDPVAVAIDALRLGLPVLVVDDADRENEGDVILAAEHATPEWIGWMVRHTSGMLCAAMPDEIADRLDLPYMVKHNEDSMRTAYTVSVDARYGVHTGISAKDRSTTLKLLASPDAKAQDLTRPGHVFPLRARPGGVLERPGHTEAAVDLCRLAGLNPVGVLCEVVDDEGPTTRLPGLRVLADRFGLALISIADLAQYRLDQTRDADHDLNLDLDLDLDRDLKQEPVEPLEQRAPQRVERVTESRLPTRHDAADSRGFRAVAYRDVLTGHEHVALVAGTPAGSGALVRVHSECLTGDAFGSSRCDCGPQLQAAMEQISLEGGVVVYLRGHEGRGIGLLAKLTAYALQDDGLDTVAANTVQGLPVDAREYGAAAAILRDLGLDDVRLLTNNPAKVSGLAEHGISTAERLPIQVGRTAANEAYLVAKRDLMGHELDEARDEL